MQGDYQLQFTGILPRSCTYTVENDYVVIISKRQERNKKVQDQDRVLTFKGASIIGLQWSAQLSLQEVGGLEKGHWMFRRVIVDDRGSTAVYIEYLV